MLISLLDEYFSEEECKKAIEEYNKDKSPDEELRYCSYFNSLTDKRMYVPCTKEYFYLWRNESKRQFPYFVEN